MLVFVLNEKGNGRFAHASHWHAERTELLVIDMEVCTEPFGRVKPESRLRKCLIW